MSWREFWNNHIVKNKMEGMIKELKPQKKDFLVHSIMERATFFSSFTYTYTIMKPNNHLIVDQT